MENPWKTIKDITKKEYIADCDKEAIGKLLPDKVRNLQFNYLPQPYMGNPKQAKIFLLNGNPNAPDNSGGLSQRECESNKKCKNYILYSLEHRIEKENYPLYALSPDFRGYSISHWWRDHLYSLFEKNRRKYNALPETTKDAYFKPISEKLFVAEYFPYFSEHFNDVRNISVPSQEYTFDLIRGLEADNDKIIIIMRGKNEWENKIKWLKKHPDRVIKLNSDRNITLAPKNMAEGTFDRILQLLASM